jgi:hypothetical protein
MQRSHFPNRGLVSVQSLERRQLLAGTASISGAVYNDLNNNTVHETGEAGIKNARVYLDYDNDGVWDKGKEPTTLTDKRGSFSFQKLGAGTYRLRQIPPSDMWNIGPRSGWFKISLAKGQQVTRRLFANAPISDYIDNGAISGSTDFNGTVNFDDYVRDDNNPNNGWFNGDFNMSGSVDLDDYALIDAAFIQQNGHLGGALTVTNTASVKATAKEDFAAAKWDEVVTNAVKWLTGQDKHVRRTSSLQAVIDHYHQLGIDYKRAFLKLAKNA